MNQPVSHECWKAPHKYKQHQLQRPGLPLLPGIHSILPLFPRWTLFFWCQQQIVWFCHRSLRELNRRQTWTRLQAKIESNIMQFVCYYMFTAVIVLSAVSVPILKSDPGTLLETVAGMTTRGIQSSSYFSLACTICRPPRNAWDRKEGGILWNIAHTVFTVC